MAFDLVETLCELVAIPSVNPMGRPASGPPFFEAQVTEYLEQLLRRLGLHTQRQTVAPGRDNLVGRLDGDVPPEKGGRLLLFDAHQDTVPADNMTIEPWTPTVREGRVYGRGACDTKGGMAAMLATVARLAAERPKGMPTILMACTVDEEYHLAGAPALVRQAFPVRQAFQPDPSHRGADPQPVSLERLTYGRAPDAAVIAEPTGLDAIVAHKGVVRWHCHAVGRAAHSSKPDAGHNAIYKMARVVAAVERYEQDALRRWPSHPLCGPHTLNVGTIHGGSSINIVPDRCDIEIELRLPPGATPELARQRLIEYLAAETQLDPSAHDPPYMQAPPLSDETNGPLSERLCSVVAEVAGRCQRRGVPYATDAAFYSGAGIPAVVFGPGSIEQAHTEEEWLPLDQLEQAAEILYRFVKASGRS